MIEELLTKLHATLTASVSHAKPISEKDIDGGLPKVKFGTTLAAVNCGVNGVVIGGESRVTLMEGAVGKARIADDTFKKLFPIDDSTVLAFAGAVGHGLAIRQYLKYFFGVWRDIYRHVSAKGKVRTLSGILAQTGADIVLLLALWDEQRVKDRVSGAFRPRGGRLYMLMSDGAYLKLDYATVGSGSDAIRMTLREYCEMFPTNERNPVDVALMIQHLLSNVGKVDPYSGGNPHVQIVNAYGVLDVMFERTKREDAPAAPPEDTGDPKNTGEGGEPK